MAKSAGWNTPLPTPISAASGNSQPMPGASDAAIVPPASSVMPPSSTGRAPTRSTTKPAANWVRPLAA